MKTTRLTTSPLSLHTPQPTKARWKKLTGLTILTGLIMLPVSSCAKETDVIPHAYEAVATGKNSTTSVNTADDVQNQPGQEQQPPAPQAPTEDIATEGAVPDINTLTDQEQKVDPSKDSMSEPVAIRVGEHTGYDRVVLEFSGPGTPGYRTLYLDKPTRQVSGNPVKIKGQTALNVDVTGTTMPVNVATAPVSPIPGKGNIIQVIPAGTFEDNSQFIVDMRSARPYTVGLLKNPTRVVIDFQK